MKLVDVKTDAVKHSFESLWELSSAASIPHVSATRIVRVLQSGLFQTNTAVVLHGFVVNFHRW